MMLEHVFGVILFSNWYHCVLCSQLHSGANPAKCRRIQILQSFRGRSSQSGLTTRMVTTGLATRGSVNWHSVVATNWDLRCRHSTPAGTGPSTAGLLCMESHATTSFRCLATRVTPGATHSATTTEWFSPRTTETTTRGSTAATATTVQCSTAGDSGTMHAAIVESTVSVWITSNGTHRRLELWICVHLACGSRARSLHWLCINIDFWMKRFLVASLLYNILRAFHTCNSAPVSKIECG